MRVLTAITAALILFVVMPTSNALVNVTEVDAVNYTVDNLTQYAADGDFVNDVNFIGAMQDTYLFAASNTFFVRSPPWGLNLMTVVGNPLDEFDVRFALSVPVDALKTRMAPSPQPAAR